MPEKPRREEPRELPYLPSDKPMKELPSMPGELPEEELDEPGLSEDKPGESGDIEEEG